MSYVELRSVTKRFGTVTAVSDLCINIEKGECFSMLGPSGCGKTTTLRMVAGFEDLDEGEISVGGELVSSSLKKYYLPPEKRNFGMVFQAFAVWPHLNVFNNVAFPLQIRNLPRHEIRERAGNAIRYTGLDKYENAYPNELSSGQKQRIALARAIAINPSVMLLDEPLSNLDPKLREEMRFEIKDLQRKFGFTIIFVTHDQSEAMALSDRILVMRDGVAEQVDTPMNIYTKPANRFIFSFIGLSNFLPVIVNDNAVFIEGAENAGIVTRDLPQDIKSNRMTLACRPSEIELVKEGGVRARVKRKANLGDTIDYRIMIGTTEVRVQKGRRSAAFEVGQECGVKFTRVLWYEA
ncbi:MAG TPA: ABC transporter ATP-binding protein [Nitrospirota bacterium]|nr:ABC transporter ATP-binding protein [Nitrospirota bacterium]